MLSPAGRFPRNPLRDRLIAGIRKVTPKDVGVKCPGEVYRILAILLFIISGALGHWAKVLYFLPGSQPPYWLVILGGAVALIGGDMALNGYVRQICRTIRRAIDTAKSPTPGA